MIPKQRRVGIYLRVSQSDQNTDNQRIDLERGWNIVEIYLDHGVSGKRAPGDWELELDLDQAPEKV